MNPETITTRAEAEAIVAFHGRNCLQCSANLNPTIIAQPFDGQLKQLKCPDCGQAFEIRTAFFPLLPDSER